MDGVTVALDSRGVTVEAVLQCAKYRIGWRAMVHMKMIEFQEAILLGSFFSFGPSSRA